jgi:hypothetical protein
MEADKPALPAGRFDARIRQIILKSEREFSQGKNSFYLNIVRARAAKKSESRIKAIFLVRKLVNFNKKFLISFFQKTLTSHFSSPCILIKYLYENIAFKYKTYSPSPQLA